MFYDHLLLDKFYIRKVIINFCIGFAILNPKKLSWTRVRRARYWFI